MHNFEVRNLASLNKLIDLALRNTQQSRDLRDGERALTLQHRFFERHVAILPRGLCRPQYKPRSFYARIFS
jgi:hypothetical protein